MGWFLADADIVPGVHHVIGWRDLKQSLTRAKIEGWTAKIGGHSGAFGIYFDAIVAVAGWIIGRFNLSYFPDPQENFVELFSLQAAAYTRQKDYHLHIRDFLAHPQLCKLFYIGRIDLGIKKADNALILGLDSVSHQRMIAIDGISLPREGQLVELVKPGGYDQNFPSYKTALAFYQVLAASLTFHLESPPSYMRYLCRPGKDMVYDAAGHHWQIPLDDSHEEALYLGYGKASFESIIEAVVDKTVPVSREIIWEKGADVIPEYKEALWWNARQVGDD